MIKGIITLAPAINMRVALWNLVDYIDEAMSAIEDEEVGSLRIEDILEVVTQSMVTLDYNLDDGFHVGGITDNGDENKITIEEVEKFKKLLGIDPDDNNKEETND